MKLSVGYTHHMKCQLTALDAEHVSPCQHNSSSHSAAVRPGTCGIGGYVGQRLLATTKIPKSVAPQNDPC